MFIATKCGERKMKRYGAYEFVEVIEMQLLREGDSYQLSIVDRRC